MCLPRPPFAGGISEAIRKTKQYLKDKNKNLEIIVEARNLEEVNESPRSSKINGFNMGMNFSYFLTNQNEAKYG